MKKQTRILLSVLLTAICVVSVCALTACKGDGGVDGTYYFGYDGKIIQNNYYTLKNKTWTDNGGSSGKFELNGNNIMLYVDMSGMQTEYMSGTVSDGVLMLQATVGNFQYYFKDGKIKDVGGKPAPQPTTKVTVTFDANGGSFGGANIQTQQADKNSLIAAPDSPTRQNYKFGGWSKTKILGTNLWDFATDTVTEDTTLYAVWKGESARIFSVDGATINDYEINLIVNHDTDSVSLSNKVVCSEDSIWKLYYDKLGQMEIPTKIAASASGALKNGSNVFYMVVTSKDGVQTNLYTLNVYRSYAVSVSYVANGKVIQTDSAYTGYPYEINYTPQIEGYTFNYWKDGQGAQVTSATPFAPLTFVADATANDYKCNLNVNGGNALDKTDFTFTYDKQFILPRAYRTGYTFLGWYVGETQLTNGSGNGVSLWSMSENVTAKAKWQANKYDVALTNQNTDLGDVSGAGEYDYDSRVTVIAQPKTGCNFVGWYDSAGKLVSENKSYTFTMGFDVSYTAKFDAYTVTTSRSDTSAGTIGKTYTNEKVTVGTKVTLTATVNDGYNFLGWYDKTTDTLVERDLTYAFTMPRKNISVVAKYNYFTVTANRNDSSAGSVTAFSNKKVSVGQSVTLTATTNAGYTWIGWFDGETKLTDELTYTFTMSAVNVTYTAKWSKVSVEKSISSAGTVTSLNEKYKVGDEVTLTATTNVGYTWVGWFDGETKLTDELTYTFTMPAVNVTYTAKFAVMEEMSNFIFNSTSTTCIITGIKDKTVESIVVPDCVTDINDYAFRNCNALVTVTIGNGVRIIGNDTFNGCSNLTNVIIGRNLKRIGDNVISAQRDTFYGCTSLANINYLGTIESWCEIEGLDNLMDYGLSSKTLVIDGKEIAGDLVIPDTVMSIPSGAFEKTNVINVMFEKDSYCESIDESAFSGCESLIRITIPESITSIKGSSLFASQAFKGCRSLASINYLGTIESWFNIQGLGNLMQYGTSGRTLVIDGKEITGELVIPSAVTSIPSYAFYNYTNITSVTFEENSQCTSIDSYAFAYCSSLTSILIPDSVTSIGNYAFNGCSIKNAVMPTCAISSIPKTHLQTVVITSGNSIYFSAFRGCSLTSITIPFVGASKDGTENTHFGYIFGANKYYDYNSSAKKDYGNAYYVPSSLKTVVITGGNKIAANAFYNCSNITSITIPDSVTSIGSSAFTSCSSLASINYLGTIESWCNIQGLNNLMYYGTSSKTLVIDGKEITGDLIIPDTVTAVPSYAFYNCTNITRVTFEENSQCTSIGSDAFSGCSYLASVTIPDSVTSIGKGAFEDCRIKSITIPFVGASKDGMSNTHFGYIFGAYSWQGTYYSGSDKYINGNADCVPSSLKTIVITGGNMIYDGAFRGCSNITSVTIPDSVTSIGSYAFYGCSKLTTINFTGTISQWNSITKGSSWKGNVPATKVICSDGEVAL